MRSWLGKNGKRIWYMLCFLFLGVIDQRRGSAVGEIQMIFSNATGIVMAFLLLPSLNWKKFREKVYLYWTPVCLLFTVIACIVGVRYWEYAGQWISGVLNLTVWSYLILYLIRQRRILEIRKRLRQPFFWCIAGMLLLMQLSAHGGVLPLWYLLIFGGFYLIGIPEENHMDFFQGMLNGMILWFFIQQILAFGFRPYDYPRYKGLYSGETQNGLFYLIIYCAFLLKWILAKEQKANSVLTWFYFLLSAGSISFLIFTGSRSGLLGAAFVTAAAYVWYDIVWGKSFYRLLGHGAMLLLCVVLTFPAVYGCIRYLPAVLTHPVWFEGEYSPARSICSYDPWDSPKYISFEEAMEDNVGRILDALGIDYNALKTKLSEALSGMKVHAAETAEIPEAGLTADIAGEPGSSPENPFMIEGTDLYSATGARKVIYIYYGKHLNLIGHSPEESGFYITEYTVIGHAHNMFLQMAYDYGVIAGVMYLTIYGYSLYRTCKLRRPENLICLVFLLAVAGFGLTEMAVTPGQITVPLVWIMFYFVGKDSYVFHSRKAEAEGDSC